MRLVPIRGRKEGHRRNEGIELGEGRGEGTIPEDDTSIHLAFRKVLIHILIKKKKNQGRKTQNRMQNR
jgi:hypothetical protein